VLEAGIYHKTSVESLPSVLAEGLEYGRQGRHSREDRVPQTNELLNRARPDELRAKGLDRHKCTYCYLAVDRWIFDVDSGLFIAEPEVAADMAVLAVARPAVLAADRPDARALLALPARGSCPRP
jgi:hypothetical protein